MQQMRSGTARRGAASRAAMQSGEELREGQEIVWNRPGNNNNSFYEAGIIESVDEGGESRREHLAVLAPPPPSGVSFQRASPFPSLWLLFSVCHSHPYTRSANPVKNAGNRSTNRYNAQQILVRLVLDILVTRRWQNPQNQRSAIIDQW